VARSFPLEHGELLTQGEDFQGSVLPTAQEDSDSGQGSKEEFEHGTLRSITPNIASHPGSPKLLILNGDRVLATGSHRFRQRAFTVWQAATCPG
jgi:hypothetical protein